MAETPLTDALDAQGILQPGEQGWWRVYGARAEDILPGDLVMIKDDEFQVAERAPWGNRWDTLRVRFRTAAGELRTVGMLQPVEVVRRGTHCTLAQSI